MAARKNSLVENINRRKRAGTSRPKSRSTVSSDAYARMEAGWPKKSTKKASATRKKASKKAGAPRKRATKKSPLEQ